MNFKVVAIFIAFVVGVIASKDLLNSSSDEYIDFRGETASEDLLNSSSDEHIDFPTEIDANILFVSNRKLFFRDFISLENFRLHKNVEGVKHYTLGARTSRDRLVASGGQNQTYASPHNVQFQLDYPSHGYGAQVTYVAIVVNQTSSFGQAYVVKGGINQHMISIIVEAYNTYVFNVVAYFYGI